MVERFQADGSGGPALFVLSLKAGGTGLTLTAANHVIHVDRWWNPAVEDQATDRAFRIGQRQRRPGPQVRLRRHRGGEDRRDDHARNAGWPRRSSAPAKHWLTELSTAQLRDLSRWKRGRSSNEPGR